MFLQKIDKLASDWHRPSTELGAVARESLLYGMRLVRNPSPLKKELKKVQISSLIAKPMWSGNAYLLITLPEVLSNKKKKIPCLADFLFAREVLTKEQRKEIKLRVKRTCKIPREKLLKNLLPKMKKTAWRGRFLPQFDPMYEHIKDVEHDLIVEALSVVNKEISNFRSNDPEEIKKYLAFCADKKANTYLKQHTPKQMRARLDQEDLDRVVHQAREEEHTEHTFADLELQGDLKRVLSPKVFLGVSLLMGFAQEDERRKFHRFLREKNLGRRAEKASPATQKSLIEKYVGAPVFEQAMGNEALRDLLLNRASQGGETDDFIGGYAGCVGL